MVISMTTDHDFPDKGRKLISVRDSRNGIGLSFYGASRILSWKGLFFLNPHPRICYINFRGRGRERETSV